MRVAAALNDITGLNGSNTTLLSTTMSHISFKASKADTGVYSRGVDFYFSFIPASNFTTPCLHAYLLFVRCQSFLASRRYPAGWCVRLKYPQLFTDREKEGGERNWRAAGFLKNSLQTPSVGVCVCISASSVITIRPLWLQPQLT